MNVGKTLFAQVMEFISWKSFGRIIDRHNGDAGVRTLNCANLFRLTDKGKALCKRRRETVERSFADAKELH